MTRFTSSFLIAISLLLFSCNQGKGTNSSGDEDARTTIEASHQKTLIIEKEALKFDIELYFRKKLRLNASQYMSSTTDYLRLDHTDGRQSIFDGKEVWLSPDTIEVGRTRFDIFTWSYFFALPIKLTDEGTFWEALDDRIVDGIAYQTGKLTFGDGVGDAPDDWYLIYIDKETNLVRAAAYIVTFNSDVNVAELEPHAIVYHDYESHDGVPFARNWTFHNWNTEENWTDTLGQGILSNFQFLKRDEITVKTDSSFQNVPR